MTLFYNSLPHSLPLLLLFTLSPSGGGGGGGGGDLTTFTASLAPG